MPEPTYKEQLTTLVVGLIDLHFDALVKLQDRSEKRKAKATIAVELGLNGLNHPTIKAVMSYGQDKTKDARAIECGDPRQGKMTYDLKA